MNVDEYKASVSRSRFLKASDVKDGDIVTIRDVTIEEVKDFNTEEMVDSWVIHFDEGSRPYKPYILRTQENIKMLRAFLGGDSDDWIGRQVELYTEPTKLGLGLRFRMPSMENSNSPK